MMRRLRRPEHSSCRAVSERRRLAAWVAGGGLLANGVPHLRPKGHGGGPAPLCHAWPCPAKAQCGTIDVSGKHATSSRPSAPRHNRDIRCRRDPDSVGTSRVPMSDAVGSSPLLITCDLADAGGRPAHGTSAWHGKRIPVPGAGGGPLQSAASGRGPHRMIANHDRSDPPLRPRSALVGPRTTRWGWARRPDRPQH